MDPIKVAANIVRERKEALKNLDSTIRAIARKAREILGGECQVYLFGSYVKGCFHPFWSDIDMIIVSDRIAGMTLDERVKVIIKLKEGLKAQYMYEIHLVTPKEFEWYKFFAKELVRI